MNSYNLSMLEKLELEAKKKLDAPVYDFIAGGAGKEWGVENNRSVFKNYAIIPKVLNGNGLIDTSITYLNSNLTCPILMAPCAFHKLVCEEGEVATAKAAKDIGTIFTLSTMSSCTLEEVAKINSPRWFQLYCFKNREVTRSLVRHAEAAGYQALVITVDVPAMGARWRDINNEFKLPPHIDAANFRSTNLFSLSEKTHGSKIKLNTDQQFDSSMSWNTIDWLAGITKLPIILKGILQPYDAAEALKHNVSAIIVSNHGGRQLDCVVSGLDQLSDIAEIINNRIPIFLDGGIRSGEDIFKALALGADGVMIGRPILWSLAVGGKTLLTKMFGQLKDELVLTMRLAGCNTLQQIKELGLQLIFNERLYIKRQLKDIFKQKKSLNQLGSETKLFSRL